MLTNKHLGMPSVHENSFSSLAENATDEQIPQKKINTSIGNNEKLA